MTGQCRRVNGILTTVSLLPWCTPVNVTYFVHIVDHGVSQQAVIDDFVSNEGLETQHLHSQTKRVEAKLQEST